MLAKIETLIRDGLIEPGSKVVVAVSGGPDSVALLHLLWSLNTKYNISLHVAHLNHQIRGLQAVEDAQFVAALSRQLNLPVTLASEDIPGIVARTGGSLEDVARRQRYQFLFRMASVVGAQRIAVGHHADDQAETLLLHLIRGSGTEGLQGMLPIRGMVIRPLLAVTRQEINNYLAANQMEYCQDQSNLDRRLTRNRVRLELLPALAGYNPRIVAALNRTAAIMQQENNYMTLCTRQASASSVSVSHTGVKIILKHFNNLHQAIQRRVLRDCWIQLEMDDMPGCEHLERLLELAVSGNAGQLLILPGGVRVEKAPGSLLLSKTETRQIASSNFRYLLQLPGITRIPEACGQIETAEVTIDQQGSWPQTGNEVYLADDQLNKPLWVRNRLPGDRFQPSGMQGTKKIKKYFLEAGIPKSQRDRVLLVTDNQDKILWIAGFRLRDGVAATHQMRAVRIKWKPCST